MDLKIERCRTQNVHVVLYGYETLTLTFKEGHRFRVFDGKILMRILRPMRREITGRLRILCNVELHVESLTNFRMFETRKMRWMWHAFGR
jgi:hypothetical protein